jgi:hypothetical protein
MLHKPQFGFYCSQAGRQAGLQSPPTSFYARLEF